MPYSRVDVIGSGPAIVFLHGYPLDRRLWSEQVAALQNDFQCITVDLPGFGNAAAVTPEDMSSMAAMAGDLNAALLDANVTGQIVLCGLSMGGYVAFEYWSQFTSRVSGLILCHTKATSDPAVAIESRKSAAKIALEHGTKPAVEKMINNLLSEYSLMTDRTLKTRVEAMSFAVPPATIATAQLAMAVRNDFTSRLDSMDVPALVIAGTDDEIATSETMQKMARAMPRAKFYAIDDAAHLSPIESPERFTELVRDFMNSIAT